ncbi:glutathione S-transferase family protein [Salinisphaera hydrothermalis]|uniref:glutathione S-transferase family protein n=1 Tax=Salinisphaera hydrothermalis TaxID=563188 RepID=UPI003341E79B
MRLHLYGHRLSQPCRAVETLLRELGAPYQWQEVDFANGATHEPWYAERVNAFQTVPTLIATHDDSERTHPALHIGESHAIMRYLCRTTASPAAADWYPGDRDPARAADIDQWLDWHHANIRRYDMFHHIMNLHLTLPMLKREIQTTLLKPLQDGLRPALAQLESRLARRTDTNDPSAYLCDDDAPSIADLAIACELYQIVAVGYRFDRFPAVQRWLDTLGERRHFRDVAEAVMAQGRTIQAEDGDYLDRATAFA